MDVIKGPSIPGLSVRLTARVRSVLLFVSIIPAITIALVAVIVVPGLAGAYPQDILFWSVLVMVQFFIFLAAGTLHYRLIIKSSKKTSQSRRYVFFRLGRRQRIAVVWMECIILSLISLHVGLHVTNPYAKVNIVQQPYVTSVEGRDITVKKNFDIHVASGPLAELTGYYKSGFLIVQNAWFGSYPAESKTTDGIIDDIHRLRFDPSKPYLISGDQFSVLYPRNLGVFYNSLLDHRTAHSQQDWENRQRIYMQSALYALDAFSGAHQITTTIVPISPRSVALTQVHPGSIASDSLYGILYAFDRLENAPDVQTTNTAKEIIKHRKDDLSKLLDVYLDAVRDKDTGMIQRHIHLASARDGITRDSSFYDNVVLWKTLQLADSLGIRKQSKTESDSLRTRILATFWQPESGYFRDDQTTSDFSSDWLIALPTGFLRVEDLTDRAKIESIISYTKKQRLDEPFPIRYSATNSSENVPLMVRKFVPNYGGDAIWSYWGAQYISLLAEMYRQGGTTQYKDDAQRFVDVYRDKIEQTRGFPETFDTNGNFLQNSVYKSIRQTGWVVQFEQAQVELKDP